MNKQKWILLVTVFVLLGATAGFLQYWRTHQKLGAPGVKATAIVDSIKMDIQLPEQVLDYTSEPVQADAVVTNMLPKDTSLAQRRYKASDGLEIVLTVVMMGTDRTSIHKPEYCLPGQGWKIDKREELMMPMTGAPAYELRPMLWTLSDRITMEGGQKADVRGFYVFWFTAENKLTNRHGQRVWWMTRDLILTGILERWSYISYFCYCAPNQEGDVASRLKQFVAASATEFQLPPKAGGE